MNLEFKHKRKKWPWFLFIVFVVVFGLGFYAYSFVKNFTPVKLLQSDFVKQQIIKQVGEDNAEIINFLPDLLGFSEPKTYLLLFLNNTELRPGGGFIGSYATLQLNQGQTNLLQMGGTENINTSSSGSGAPQIILDKLNVDKWYFRDSNWSPDFVISSEKTLEFYKNGNNLGANEISGVIGITTDVLEGLMKITGPFTIDGINFTSDNVIEKLEYEVEYGYQNRDIAFTERKDIMEVFFISLMDHLKNDLFSNLDNYKVLVDTLLKEKNIVIYSLTSDLAKILKENNWSGQMAETSGDYLMWVDANLAALKTDRVIKRDLNYTLVFDKNKYKAIASTTYTHSGSFNWRTTNYLSYTRVYVPTGSELISAKVGDKTWVRDAKDNTFGVDTGIENGKKWFGVYFSIEPGNKKTISFEYSLPDSIIDNVKNKSYNLSIQKQIGSNNTDLTIHLEFDKTNIVSAIPAEEELKWGDRNYDFETALIEDLNFEIKF